PKSLPAVAVVIRQGPRLERPMPFALRPKYIETPTGETRHASERRGRGDVGQPLEALDVRRGLHDAGRERDERHIELGVDPEERGARAVVAERAGRRQRAEKIRTDRVAREPEAEPEIRRVRLPAVVDRDALVELVRLVSGPVAGRELQRRRR